MRRALSVTGVLAVAVTMLAGAVAPSAQAAPGSTQVFTPTALARAIPVAPPLTVGYRGVEQFIPKAVAARKDAKGCDLRQRMIIALATKKPVVGKGCRMTGGAWRIDAGTRTVTSPKGLVLAPVTPYKLAWGGGAYAWTPAQRLAWATSTGPGATLRGKAVSTQTTQTLFSPQYLRSAIATLQRISSLQAEIGRLCSSDARSCIGILAIYQAVQSYDVSRAISLCTTLATSLTNFKAWGLAFPSWYAAETEIAAAKCNEPIAVFDETVRYSIDPVTPTSGVPATYMPAATPLFDGYGDPSSDVVTPSAFGVLAPVDWPAPAVSAGALRLWDAGVSWRQVERAKGVFDWATLDATIGRAMAYGQRVMYVLGDTPAWANGGKAGNVPPSNLADAGAFIEALCRRYVGSIAQYQVWNEGNILEFWTGSPEELARLTQTVKGAVDGCFPQAEVVASSAGARAEGGFATRYRPYLDALGALGWPVEAFSVHSYPKASGGPMERVGILQQWKAMLSAAGAPELPLYDTELNYGLAGLGEPRVAIDDATGAAWIGQSMVQSVQYGIDGQYWFLWTGDVPYDKLGIQLYAGSRQTISAWNGMRDWLLGTRMQRCAQQDNLYGCQLTGPAGQKLTIAWAVSGSATLVNASLGSVVCTLNGPCAVLGQSVQVGAMPVLIRGY